MKIAMPYQDGVLLEHFGRAKEFIIYNVSDLDPVTSEVIAPEDLSHAAVARTLKEHGVDVVLCGSIGEHARQAVEGEHMLVFSGITGAADDVLERFLQGNLEAADGDFAAEGGCGGAGGEVDGEVDEMGALVIAEHVRADHAFELGVKVGKEIRAAEQHTVEERDIVNLHGIEHEQKPCEECPKAELVPDAVPHGKRGRAEKEQHGKPLDHPAEGVRAAEALLPVGDGGQILLRGGGEKALSSRCWRRSSG